MIDFQARQRLFEAKKQDRLVSGMKDVVSQALRNNGSGNEEVLKLVVKREEDQAANEMLGKIGQALAKVYSKIPGAVQLPKIFQIQGRVKADITSMPNLKITNLSDLQPYFASLEKRLGQLATAVSMIAATPPPTPKDIKFPEFDTQSLIDAIDRIPGGEGMSKDVIDKLDSIAEGIGALYNRPQMTPAPATHMSLNSLAGVFKATTINITSTATVLPPQAIANRRSLIVYNNSANTIYLGGPTVAISGVGQGLPVPTATYSPPFDPGQNMSLYGIAASSSSVTILETSDESSGK